MGLSKDKNTKVCCVVRLIRDPHYFHTISLWDHCSLFGKIWDFYERDMVMSASLWRKLTAGARMARDKLLFAIFKIFFAIFTSSFGLRTDCLIREKFICGSKNVKICNSFLDLKNFPTRSFKNIEIWNTYYFWSVPFRLPYGSRSVACEYLQAMTSWHEQSLLLTFREAFLSYLTLHALLGKCDLLTVRRLVKDVKFVVKSRGK